MSAFRLHTSESRNHIDVALLIISVLILIGGMVMLFSASVAVGIERFGDANFFIKRQLMWLAIGLVAGYIGYKVDYHYWQKWSLFILLGSILLLVTVFIPGIGAGGNGAQRWVNLGIASFQPSEFVKLSLVVYLAAWLSERGHQAIQDFKTGLIPIVAVLAVIGFLILKQPDLGTLIIIALIAIGMYFIGGAHTNHLIGLVGIGAAIAAAAIALAPYRMARFTSFLNPSADPQGTGYHITQSLIAVGSGGFFGLGLGHSRQKFLYLPEVTGDSIFAVIAEELGFMGSITVIALFLLFFWRSIHIARRAPDAFGKLMAAGIGSWIVLQAFINIGAMLGVLPLTGVTLPLVSYGGSSLIVTLVAIGILLNISKTSRA
ncbi:putative lipid II flippase FtsW [bacterium CG10_46_32]|nr:MAG: putative lipid II flippase FtsW [bacterium CG10_46_32]PIR56088.1 MAG: putative lipid II flippase FtsW [Parcubacteria group bacterium CG10_big_fil_rev_8_21_14_0_10_46_32]